MVDSVVLSQRLLRKKKRLENKATPAILNELWTPFDSTSPAYKKSQNDLKNCLKITSKWVLRRTPNINKYYEVSKNTTGGPGGTASFYKAKSLKNGKTVGVKVIDKSIIDNDAARKKFYQSIRTETYVLWKLLDHPNIVGYHAIFETERYVQVVMDYCDGGELFDKIVNNGRIQENISALYLRQICSAIYYMHSRGVVHCDLKPENILIKNEKGKEVIKLIDFGLSKIHKQGSYLTEKTGTYMYMSPEQIDGKYDETADIWSVGVILYTMIYGIGPWYSSKDNEYNMKSNIIKRIKKGFDTKMFPKKPNNISKECKHLIHRLLQYNVGKRLTASETLEHPFLMKVVGDKSNIITFANPEINKSLINASKKKSLFQNEVVHILKDAGYLDKYQEKALIQFFKRADVNNDGFLSYDEVYHALKLVDNTITKEYANELCKGADINNDGNISIDELMRIRILQKLNNKQERTQSLFDYFDLNGDGNISKQELEKVLCDYFSAIDPNYEIKKLKKRVHKIVQQCDLDGDGNIDYDEFLKQFQTL